MFVIGEEARSSRHFGLPGVVALMVLAVAVTVAVRWGLTQPPQPPASAPAVTGPAVPANNRR